MGIPFVFIVSDDCDRGAVLDVSVPANVRTFVVAYAADRTVTAFTLVTVAQPDGSRALTARAFVDGRETQYLRREI